MDDGFGTSAPNLGAGDHGKGAAPTHSSTQKAVSHLSRRGRTTCGTHRPCVERVRRALGKVEVYTAVRVGRDFGEREGACRFWACFPRRGFSPDTDDDDNCRAAEGAPQEVSRCMMRGECGWRACGLHVGGVIMQQSRCAERGGGRLVTEARGWRGRAAPAQRPRRACALMCLSE